MRHTLPMLVGLVGLVGCQAAEPRAVTSPSPDLAEIVEGHNAFAVDLYQQATTSEENAFFSPFSVSAALGMTYVGAAGETASQMEDALHIQSESGDYHAEFGALIQDLSGDKNRGYSLHIANRLYGQQGMAWEPSFIETTESDYGAPMQMVDFPADPDGIRGEINTWVEDTTQGRIEDLLQPGFLTADTRLVLVNAIYFQADWAEAFDKDLTRRAPFYGADGESEVQMMMATESFPYAQVDGATVVELPYKDDEISMVLVVPDSVDGLASIESELTGERLDYWMDQLAPGVEVQLSMPRFEMTEKLDLKPILEDLGMVDAFAAGGADFSGMAPADLYITDVVHKAFVKVDEEGTEAAAATGVGASVTSLPEQIEVKADRPFLFVIRDRLSGSVLFMGRVAQPAEVSIQ